MPESKGRSKPAYTPPRTAQSNTSKPNPRWFVPLMLALMLIGLIWVVTYYISGTKGYPVPQFGRWNLGAGFAFMMAGFLMTTRWR